MALTGKQEAFAQALADGMTPSEAYRSAYDPKTMSSLTLRTEAYRTGQMPAVAARIATLKAEVALIRYVTRDRKRQVLAQVIEGKLRGREIAGRMKAIEIDNAMTGDNAPIKQEFTGLGELLQEARKRAKKL